MSDKNTNPLLRPSPHPNKVPDFPAIDVGHYLPAIEAALVMARAEVAAIRDNPAKPDFANTIQALETAGEELGATAGLYYTMVHMAGTDDLQALSDQIGTLTSAFGSDVSADKALFKRVAAVYKNRDDLPLSIEERTLLDNTYRGFVRNGVNLPAAKQARLKKLNQELAMLGPQFGNNQSKSLENYSLWLTDTAALHGLPPTLVAMAKDAAQQKGRIDGCWRITLDMPSYVPFMRYSTRRDLREALWRDSAMVAQEKPFDNRPLVKKIITLRHKRAQLLGYDTHAAFVLEERMAKTPETVHAFLNALITKYFAGAKQDLKKLQEFAKAELGIADLQPWDVLFVREKLRAATYALDEEALRPYFKLENVLEGTFTHFSKLFNIRFTANAAYPAWHKDVMAYDVFDNANQAHLGTFFADFFLRIGKNPGAWQTTIRSTGLFQGQVERPVVAIVCNFTPSSPGMPSLLTFDEVLTLFHEMGHAMHNLLAQGTYQSLTGTSVLWDFVELPSQLQENWCYQPETLAIIGRHYETEAVIPAALVAKLIASKNFMVAWDGFTQAKYAMLDLAWHTTDPALSTTDIAAFEDTIMAPYRLLPQYPGLASTTYSHIFNGAYDAGYYSYKWAEVLEADAFEAFLDAGIYDPATAAAYRTHVLAQGGIHPPDDLYRAFRGRDADPDALLRREGLSA
ncbi:MAG: M3 family metallopeptidase [Pseudomonadota bacterium]